jgi:hypothetical protein
MTVAANETAVVRDLARRVAEVAASERNRRVLQRWRDVNALRVPDRAPVWCRPVGAWGEILPDDALVCADSWLRGVERSLRRKLFKHEVGDDEPFLPTWDVPVRFDVDPPNTWGVSPGRHGSGAAGGAWAYDPPLKTEADFDRLRLPTFRYNEAATAEALARHDEVLGDILPVRRVCGPPLTAVLGMVAADLRGLNEIMLDMPMNPGLMHRLMSHIRDGVLKAMDEVEATGLLTPNTDGPMTCSDPIGEPQPDGSHTFANLWVHANSQEFDAVSPAMWEEFCLNYQKPIMARFGLAHYGCCENLSQKMEGVMSIPNLRIFVCSAWTDLQRLIERVGSSRVIMWRQKATDVVFPDDPETVRADLQAGARALQGCRYQIVLRELQTLAGHPDRLHDWTRLAIEAAEAHA